MARLPKPGALTNRERQAAFRAREKEKIRPNLEPWAVKALNKMALDAGKTADAIATELITTALQTKARRTSRRKAATANDQTSLFDDLFDT